MDRGARTAPALRAVERAQAAAGRAGHMQRVPAPALRRARVARSQARAGRWRREGAARPLARQRARVPADPERTLEAPADRRAAARTRAEHPKADGAARTAP